MKPQVRWVGGLVLGVFGVGAAVLAAVGGGLRRSMPQEGEAAGPPLAAARVDERLGAGIPLELRFVDGEGRSRVLGELIGSAGGTVGGVMTPVGGVEVRAGGVVVQEGGLGRGRRPTLLILAYYGCRTLCNVVLEGTARALGDVEWRAGREYEVVVVSIDPRDSPADSREKVTELEPLLARTVAGEVGARGSATFPGWTFLVGAEPDIEALAAAVGFGYRYDKSTDQYSHPAVVFALTPSGAVSSYIYGVNPEPRELATALSVAASGGTRSVVERILLRCFHYIPALRRHAGLIAVVLRVGGILTVLAAAVVFWRLVLRAPGRVAAR